MLPIFFKYKVNYIISLWIALVIVSMLLSFAFVRNSTNPNNAQVFLFCVVLAGGISFVTFRDAMGFWTYCMAVKKFHLVPHEKNVIRSYQKSPLKRLASKFLLYPGAGAILVSLTLLVVLIFVGRFMEANKPWVLMAVVGIGFPTVLSTYILLLVPAYVALAESTLKVAGNIRSYQVRKRIRICTAGDLAVSLGINLTVVLPLSGHVDFSLAKGYLSPDFLVATLIMMWIVTFFTLLGAKSSRLFTAAGEVLSRSVHVDADNESQGGESAILGKGKGLGGELSIYIGLSFWLILVALVFSTASAPPHFGWFYAVLLVPLMVVFVYQRSAKLMNEYTQARLLETEMPEFAYSVDT